MNENAVKSAMVGLNTEGEHKSKVFHLQTEQGIYPVTRLELTKDLNKDVQELNLYNFEKVVLDIVTSTEEMKEILGLLVENKQNGEPMNIDELIGLVKMQGAEVQKDISDSLKQLDNVGEELLYLETVGGIALSSAGRKTVAGYKTYNYDLVHAVPRYIDMFNDNGVLVDCKTYKHGLIRFTDIYTKKRRREDSLVHLIKASFDTLLKDIKLKVQWRSTDGVKKEVVDDEIQNLIKTRQNTNNILTIKAVEEVL